MKTTKTTKKTPKTVVLTKRTKSSRDAKILKSVEKETVKAQNRLYKILDSLDLLATAAEEGSLSPNVIGARIRKISESADNLYSDLEGILYTAQDGEGYGWDLPINGSL